MSNYVKPNVYIGNDLVWSEKHPRHGWSDRTLFKHQLALQECGHNLHDCYFEILNEGGWITYMRADSESIPDFSDEDDIKDSFYDSYVSEIKKYKPSGLTVEDWVKTLSPFGIKLEKGKDSFYFLSSEYSSDSNKWAIYEENPTVPDIKSIMFDPENKMSEALMFLDIPNSLHPPLSGEANSPSPNWVINIYYLNNCVWSTKNCEYPHIASTWEEEAQGIRYIIENCCDQSWIAHWIMLEIVTKDGPIYRNLDSFEAKILNNDRDDNKIVSKFNEIPEESWSYDDEDDCKTILHQLGNLGFAFCSGVLSHKKVGLIKDFGDKSFDDFYEITLTEIKAAIWGKKELREALNSICITNPLHLPWSSYEGIF